VETNRGDREREAAKAREIIDTELKRFFERMHSLSVVPTIVSLQEQMENIRQAEIDKVRGRLGALTPEQEVAIEAMTKGILNKILHAPITELKSAAQKGNSAPEFTTLLDAVRRMFHLRVAESVTPEKLEAKEPFVEKTSVKR
jgi:glutamyl-tRNA reductase